MDVKGNSTQCDNLLYLRLFLKSTVTSDYNELDISVTHLLHMIFYMSFLRVLWPPWLLGSEAVAHCAVSDTVRVSECGSNESLKYCINQPPCKSKIKKRTTPFWKENGCRHRKYDSCKIWSSSGYLDRNLKGLEKKIYTYNERTGCDLWMSVLHMLKVWFLPNQFISLHCNAK